MRSVIIPDGVTEIGEYAFAACTNLTSVKIPDSATALKDWSFGYCTNLTTVTIGNNITAIGKYAFFECSALSSVTFGNHVAVINFAAFGECTGLTSLTLPKTLIDIEAAVFYHCPGIISIVFTGNAPAVESFAVTYERENFWTDPETQGLTATVTIFYRDGASGYTTPTWGGAPCFPLSASGAIDGIIRDANGSAIIHANVSLNNGLTKYTDVNGSFVFDTLPAKSFVMTITKEGYKTISRNVTVTSGQTVDAGAVLLGRNMTITPGVTAFSPTGSDLSTLSKINVTFDRKMNETETLISINGMNGSIAWNGNIASLTLSAALLGNTTYRVTVNGFDLEGTPMNTSTWSFTTASVGKISGLILDASGHPVANATVTLECSPGCVATSQTTMSDTNGRYVFYDVAIGQYKIDAIKDGCDIACSTVTMTSDDVATGGVTANVNAAAGISGPIFNTMTIVSVLTGIVVVVIVAAALIVRKNRRGK
jgi:hypothetical protein